MSASSKKSTATRPALPRSITGREGTGERPRGHQPRFWSPSPIRWGEGRGEETFFSPFPLSVRPARLASTLNSLIHKPPRLAYTPLMKAPSSSTALFHGIPTPPDFVLARRRKTSKDKATVPHQIGPFPGVGVRHLRFVCGISACIVHATRANGG